MPARSEDPATGRPFTQVRLGELLGVSDSLLSQWESGKGQPTLDVVNAIPHYLRTVTVAQLLRSLGAEIEPEPVGLSEDERELLTAYRRLRAVPILQESAIRLLRALPASQGPLIATTPGRARIPG
jgi:transcriptional regulator with XRE-family HTH domain